ncbi:hypothetical protein AALP_AA1G348000 [Arabis alpina]|uniref:CCHC-type domain-containing protein n=1 Tax=Arabis alpina TaxID=50452 RepID=A0A087HSN4_ARAAL|nr:hypothetical protein AALP_AA1G348000 [Arabis alpina]
MAIIRKFLRVLRPELRSRLHVVELTSLFQLMERDVNEEEGISDEQEDSMAVDSVKLEGGSGKVLSTPQYTNWEKNYNRARPSNRGKGQSAKSGQGMSLGGAAKVCYQCGKSGHIHKDCYQHSQKGLSAPSHITCFSCREQGHYANPCPVRHPSSYGLGKTSVGSTPTPSVGEPPMKRQAVGRVYNLEVDDTPKP